MQSPDNQGRCKVAMEAILGAYGTVEGEESVTLFVDHHLQELPPEYWMGQLGSHEPQAFEVLGLLELKKTWGADSSENFDFSLPGDVTDYVLCVHFEKDGVIDQISMES
jgi:hypothetical protein